MRPVLQNVIGRGKIKIEQKSAQRNALKFKRQLIKKQNEKRSALKRGGTGFPELKLFSFSRAFPFVQLMRVKDLHVLLRYFVLFKNPLRIVAITGQTFFNRPPKHTLFTESWTMKRIGSNEGEDEDFDTNLSPEW